MVLVMLRPVGLVRLKMECVGGGAHGNSLRD